ncbi:Glucan 1,3-beta-glucosidase 3 [Recurvomyces mirabilis]|nr:Glucan 1,3-beta-glucosidase 3 [Recurvomyces mirabilis]
MSTFDSVSLDFTLIFVIVFIYLLVLSTSRDPEIRAAMKKFFDKAKARLGDNDHGNDFPAQQQQQQVPMQDGPSSIQAPSQADIYRYRYHHGANLGSIFILERWLTGSMFHDKTDGSAELAAVERWVKEEGLDRTRERFEKHWHEYVSDGDLDWLRDQGKCTTVRLPIGYFTLGPPYCEDTPFKKVAGVLIDLHGLPGGANPQDHSGTNSGKAELWSSKGNRDQATRCLCFIAQQARGMEGVAGLQIINEAEHDAKGMYDWYDHVLGEMAKIDITLPIYISDAWDLHKAASWSQGKNRAGVQGNPVVVDTHLYWCFGDDDKRKPPQQIAQEVSGKFSPLDGKEGDVASRGAAQAIVGEYSCVLAEESWAKASGGGKEDHVRAFGNAESHSFQQRAGGSFFWTYRMDWMPGGEWGFKQMTEQGAIVPPQSLTVNDVQQRVQSAQAQQQQKKQETVGAHTNYWDSNHPGQYEHQRFEQGWELGFQDAMAFFEARSRSGQPGADKIGMLDLWILKRLKESGQGGKFVWEWEQGFRQGVRDFYQGVGV